MQKVKLVIFVEKSALAFASHILFHSLRFRILQNVEMLDDNLINNVYNISDEYRIAHLHVAILPLKGSSAIMLFCEQGEKRYRRFFRQFRKLDSEDQLAVINYMIFSYTENVFVNPSVYKLACKVLSFTPLAAAEER